LPTDSQQTIGNKMDARYVAAYLAIPTIPSIDHMVELAFFKASNDILACAPGLLLLSPVIGVVSVSQSTGADETTPIKSTTHCIRGAACGNFVRFIALCPLLLRGGGNVGDGEAKNEDTGTGKKVFHYLALE
jgi:hypothetical protein